MNDLIKLLGIGAVVYYLYSKQQATIESLQNQLKKGEADTHEILEDLDFRLELQESQDKAMANHLPVKLSMDMALHASSDKQYYNCLTTIVFTNDSTAKYTIKKVAAILTLDGGTNSYYAFGQEKVTTITKGQSATYQSTWQNEKWFKDSNDAVRFNDRYGLRERLTHEAPKGTLMANYICALVNNGIEDHVLIWNTVDGDLKIYAPGKSWSERGDNAYKWKKYDELLS